MKFEINEHGNLVFSLEDAADREQAQEMLDFATNRDSDFLASLLEDWTANGRLYPVDPSWIAALTEAPIVTDDLLIQDDGTSIVQGKVWWFPDYQVRSFAEDLIANGQVTFQAAPEN